MYERTNEVPSPTLTGITYLKLNPPCPCVDYEEYEELRNETWPFPHPSLLNRIDSYQHENVHAPVDTLSMSASDNVIPVQDSDALKKVLYEHINIFRSSLSSGRLAFVRTLIIELTPGTRMVHERLRNHIRSQ